VPPDEAPVGLGVELSDVEQKLLRALRARPSDRLPEEELAEQLALPEDVTRGTLQRLRSKRLAVVEEEREERPVLTDRGREALARGLPERRLARLLASAPDGVDPAGLEAAGFSGEERSAAIGRLRRLGWLAEGSPLRPARARGATLEPLPEERALQEIDEGTGGSDRTVFAGLQRRGLVDLEVEHHRRWGPSSEGSALALAEESVPQLGALTPALLASGAWRSQGFRSYDVRATVPYLSGAWPHPVAEWYREFEDILVGLGFQQAEGPLLETEFWNNDVLFMPQEHPARSVHDALAPAEVTGRPPPEPLGSRVARAHEGLPIEPGGVPISRGWRYPYDPEVARRPVLRSQTTAVSARFLARDPKPPFRVYCLDRNFRRDAVDAAHHVEFHQCEGILGGPDASLRELVGVFRALTEALGIRELKIRPSYFPFTEPSIEGYVRHPLLGWIEALPGGIFRPEVLRPLGVETPVAAWGIGICRLAMVSLGISDIRRLYEDDLAHLAAGRS
jgi:phenylalanyl-tRNA synthetase alpha chain